MDESRLLPARQIAKWGQGHYAIGFWILEVKGGVLYLLLTKPSASAMTGAVGGGLLGGVSVGSTLPFVILLGVRDIGIVLAVMLASFALAIALTVSLQRRILRFQAERAVKAARGTA